MYIGTKGVSQHLLGDPHFFWTWLILVGTMIDIHGQQNQKKLYMLGDPHTNPTGLHIRNRINWAYHIDFIYTSCTVSELEIHWIP